MQTTLEEIRQNMQEIVEELKMRGETITTMESCTGGGLCNEITNVPGASAIYGGSPITYCNEEKIMNGVLESIIDEYTVYSFEVARAMAKAATLRRNYDYGVGITGKINDADPKNPAKILDENNKIYIAIYDRKQDTYKTREVTAINAARYVNKELIILEVTRMMKEILKKEKQLKQLII